VDGNFGAGTVMAGEISGDGRVFSAFCGLFQGFFT
jgi:hypothetical protein